MNFPCLSLWQPYATAVSLLVKTIETRSWKTPHRGRIAIHAAKAWTRKIAQAGKPLLEILEKMQGGPGDLPFGCVVAVARIADCVPTDSSHSRLISMTYAEFRFGDYSPGRWAWLLEDIHPVLPPLPMKGHQGLRELPLDIASLLAKA